jgi:hypothetical protein
MRWILLKLCAVLSTLGFFFTDVGSKLVGQGMRLDERFGLNYWQKLDDEGWPNN